MDQSISIIEYNGQQMVDARKLHAFLEAGTEHYYWTERKFRYSFLEEGVDYILFLEDSPESNQPKVAHVLTIDTAAEIAAMYRSEKGNQCLQYFAEVKKRARVLRK